MNSLNMESVYELMNGTQMHSVSIYLPTFRKGSESGQNSIRFKNLLRDVEKHFHQRGLDEVKVNQILAKPIALLNDFDFWNHQSEGLALFFSSDEFQYFNLPYTVDEKVIINDHFHIKPLLGFLNGNTTFYIAAIDLNKTRLFRCSHFNITEVNLGDTTVKFEDFLTALSSSGNRESAFHGQGTDMGESTRKKDIIEFFRLIDKGIKSKIKENNALLIPAGVEYLIPLYKEANSYSNFSTKAINKNSHTFSTEELLSEAWEIVDKDNQIKSAEALRQYGNLFAHDKASNDIKEIIKAAHSNRILHLLVNFDDEIWGKFDSDKYDVELHSKQDDGDKELISLAVQQTLFHNGFVYPLDKEKMPNGKSLAAVFRY